VHARYKCLCTAFTFVPPQVNIQTDRHTHRQTAFSPVYINSSASGAIKTATYHDPTAAMTFDASRHWRQHSIDSFSFSITNNRTWKLLHTAR